jgi:hypothetical protein
MRSSSLIYFSRTIGSQDGSCIRHFIDPRPAFEEGIT